MATCWFVSWAFHLANHFIPLALLFHSSLPSLTICVLRYSHSLYTHTHTHNYLVSDNICVTHRTTRKPSQSSTYCFHSQYVLWVTPPTHIIFNFNDVIAMPSKQCLLCQWFVPYCLTLGNYISDHMTSWLLLTFWALIKWIQYLCSEQSKS